MLLEWFLHSVVDVILLLAQVSNMRTEMYIGFLIRDTPLFYEEGIHNLG